MVAFGKMTSISQNASMNGAQQSVRIGNSAVGVAPAIVSAGNARDGARASDLRLRAPEWMTRI